MTTDPDVELARPFGAERSGMPRETSFVPLITASRAYPALETLFWEAETEIWAGFRIFDLRTRLRSEAGRAIGKTWFDLIVHRLRAGVAIHLILADFDPHMATPLHLGTWRSVRQFAAARETAGGGRLELLPGLHPARVGWGPRTAFWPFVLRRVARLAREADAGSAAARAEFMALAVGLKARLRGGEAGATGVVRLPPPNIVPATHHQKLAVFDRSRLYIGGLDLNERRYDDPEHRRPAEQTWQDVSVIVSDPCVAEAQAHLEACFGRGEHRPAQPLAETPLSFVRTLSVDGSRQPWRLSPRSAVREIEAAHLDLFARARQLIYLETQFFRHVPIARALARAARARPDLGLIVMLPAAPEDVAFSSNDGLDARFGEALQARCVRIVQRAFGPRAFIGMPLRPVARDSDGRDTALGSQIVYIHSKVSVADDACAIVSSANLNGRSLRWDTEAGVRLLDGALVADLRERLFAHWLPNDAPAEMFSPATAVRAWAALARANAARAPAEREGFVAPYDPGPAERFGEEPPLIPPEIV